MICEYNANSLYSNSLIKSSPTAIFDLVEIVKCEGILDLERDLKTNNF